MDAFKEMMTEIKTSEDAGKEIQGLFDQNYLNSVEKERERLKAFSVQKI
jgi:hypothetical protein